MTTRAMKRAKESVRAAIRRVGVDLVRYPNSDPSWMVADLLNRNGVELVVDVGANRGQYASGLRAHGYRGHILSLEPVSSVFEKTLQLASDDGNWTVIQSAVGDHTGTLTINVAANGAASSSVLPMLETHRRFAPEANYIGTETVQVRRLDDLISDAGWHETSSTFIKVDVQGYEKAVFDGSPDLLASPSLFGLQMELSFTPLYEGGMDWRYGFDLAEKSGLSLMFLLPGFKAPSGQLLQADGVFSRLPG